MIGKQLSHYRILEKIGSGGMGAVYLAHDDKLRRNVALKLLPHYLSDEKARKERFLREARAAAAIEHPHIGAIYDVGEVDGQMFIAMEYVRGTTLGDALADRRFSLRQRLEIACQVASALAKAHEGGVVHRDLKPENVIVSDDGYAKLIDFGLAKLLEPTAVAEEPASRSELRTETGVVLGTAGYLSPEQAEGKQVDARSDIFAFGILLFEMVSGTAPFRRPTLLASLRAVTTEEPPPLLVDGESAPEALAALVARCLRKSADERYQSLKEMLPALQGLRDEPTPGAGIRRDPRVPTLVGLGSAVVLAAAAVIGWNALGHDPSPVSVGVGVAGRPAIAVMTFRDHTDDETVAWLSAGLPDMIATGLAQTPGLDVVSAQRLHAIANELGESERSDGAFEARVAERAGAGAVVVGSVYKSGDELRIDVQLDDLQQGRLIGAESVRGGEVFSLVDELTARIRARLELDDRPAGKPIQEITTPSLEAYRLYREGLDARYNIRHTDAIDRFEQAASLDPSFAMALLQLWQSALNVGDGGLGESARRRLLENLDRLPERERLLVEAQNAWNPGRDPERAIELLEQLLSAHPDEEGAYDALVHIYSRDPTRNDEMIALMERWAAAFPPPGSAHHLNHYGYALLEAGRYTEAIRKLEDYARVAPEEANPHDSLGEVYLVSGNPEKALQSYGRALEIDPSFGVSYIGRALSFGMLGRFDEGLRELGKLEEHEQADTEVSNLRGIEAILLSRVGRFREAAAAVQLAEETALARASTDRRVIALLLHAWVAFDAGDTGEVVARSEDALRKVPEMTSAVYPERATLIANLLAGVAEARSGDVEAARARLEAVDRIYDEDDVAHLFWRQALFGEIALASGDARAALLAFERGEPELKMTFTGGAPIYSLFAGSLVLRDGRARAAAALGRLEEALALYEELNTPDLSWKWVAMWEPRYARERARLYHRMGQTAEAKGEYARFQQLWKGADPGRPEVREAEAYLAAH